MSEVASITDIFVQYTFFFAAQFFFKKNSSFQDCGSGEVNKVSIEREERRLTGFGQKILETFVLSHIFRYDIYLF